MLIGLLCAPIALSAQSALVVDSLFSRNFSTVVRYSILLPEKYDTSNKYPVLFLLHGYDGGHADWTARTSLQCFVADHALIIVMPDAGNSWYVNSISDPSRGTEDLILHELTDHVSAHYSIDKHRQAIAGLSMGGYGAVMLALKHPGRFRFAGSLSGALSIPGDIDTWEHKPWGRRIEPNLKATFGTTPNEFRNTHNPFLLLKKDSASSMPYLYFVMGTHDDFAGFLPAHRALTDSLRAAGISYEYHEVPGGHSWEFWGRTIRPLLSRMMDVLK
ncbi:MAG TPA: alpha/beta hydrolase family protein [Bacteroidota bacterium]